MYCDECKQESAEITVCTHCGLVFEDGFIKTDLMPRKYSNSEDRIVDLSFRGPLSPDIEYTHLYPKHSKNPNLNRALGMQKKEPKKTEKNFYFRDLKDIERICDYLQLPKTVLNEALNIRKQIGKKTNYFNRKKYFKNVACVKVAARIHDYPLDEREFIQLARGYPIIKKGETVKLKGNEIKKQIDKYYIELIYNHLKIILLNPKRPNFIVYACNRLNIRFNEQELYKIYDKIQPFLNPSWSIKGVVLAIIHSLYGKSYKIRIVDLEKLFNVNRLTISSRKKNLEKVLEKYKDGKIKG